MTDTPNRSIDGLAPRPGGQTDLSRLQRRNRIPATPPAVPSEEQATVTPLPRPTSAEPVPVPSSAPTSDNSAGRLQDRITVYLDRDLRARARTAYRATAHLEGDRTWSDFIERAIRLEVERREHSHNSDRAFTGTSTPLPPGRTVN